MKTNVSTLRREYPKVRRAALASETVIIHTREGDLLPTAAPPTARSLLGCMKGQVKSSADDLDRPSTAPDEWRDSL